MLHFPNATQLMFGSNFNNPLGQYYSLARGTNCFNKPLGESLSRGTNLTTLTPSGERGLFFDQEPRTQELGDSLAKLTKFSRDSDGFALEIWAREELQTPCLLPFSNDGFPVTSLDSGTLELVRCGILLMEIGLSSRVEGWNSTPTQAPNYWSVTIHLSLRMSWLR